MDMEMDEGMELFPSLRGSFESHPTCRHIVRMATFPSLRGSFERIGKTKATATNHEVSIPQRKFRKLRAQAVIPKVKLGFHPSEEVSKAQAVTSPQHGHSSFHPSEEVSKASAPANIRSPTYCFHPSEEVSKGDRPIDALPDEICFHPSEEVSKGSSPGRNTGT